MGLRTICQWIFLVVTIAGTSKLTYEYFAIKKTRPPRKTEVHDVIMFGPGKNGLRKSVFSRCQISESMHQILFYLGKARRSIDICMYVLTNKDIAEVLLKLQLKGIKIRFIVDTDMAFSSGSQIQRLAKQNNPVRWMKSSNLMHHKFCLIDTRFPDEESTPFVMMGSLNWTNQALTGNWEDVTVTSQEKLVELYREEFERLWIEFKPESRFKNNFNSTYSPSILTS